METIYIIEECLVPGVWTLLNDNFYTSREEASEMLSQMGNTMLKYKKCFKGRITGLHLSTVTTNK